MSRGIQIVGDYAVGSSSGRALNLALAIGVPMKKHILKVRERQAGVYPRKGTVLLYGSRK